MAYKISDKCTACGKCKPACPVEAIVETEDKKIKIDSDACVGCGVCADECPSEAIADL
ncbi:MAG: 4Fe-4S binding protein [Verrucomicrobia bacterium]|nr:4Fe-4S binding protein [Verrucomicrobiota bacterium]MBU4291886.1 4Fe-4S binding protein [Verrucomicrobiota bacterium]MBU4429813.1 4Fe-4S binding protein [Verrucomicrobiota bacterium]MCG2680280.1 4Fe-4S binding protein [Kiritimatiellia bacterium]